MRMIERMLHAEREVSLTGYLQDASPEYAGITVRPAVVVIPGGGYSVCSNRFADCVAMGYLNAGFHAFVLRYTLQQKGSWPLPLEDYDEAMTYLLDHAAEWGVDPTRIAVCGSSAGAHLAACAATMAVHRPAAAILGYAALRQDAADSCAPGMPSPLDYVDATTCPCFLFAARDDELIPVSSTVEMQATLLRHDVPFEAHVYSRGNHGFSLGRPPHIDETIRASRWMEDSIAWLGETWGHLTAHGCEKP